MLGWRASRGFAPDEGIAESFPAGRPLHSHPTADQRPDLRAHAADGSRRDGEGQEERRPAGADLRVRRARAVRRISAAGSEFGAAHDLADFLSSDELNAADTVAYLPKPIQGHAVLAALACQEIIMADDASIGAAGIDEKTISDTLRSAYAEIAGRRRTVPVTVALGMLDPAMEVLRVETDAGNTEFVTPDELQN